MHIEIRADRDTLTKLSDSLAYVFVGTTFERELVIDAQDYAGEPASIRFSNQLIDGQGPGLVVVEVVFELEDADGS